jgi:hypothetical protein
MENIRQQGTEDRRGIRSELDALKEEIRIGKMKDETEKEKKKLKFPRSWISNMKKSNKKINLDKVLVWYLNIKGEMEHPVLLPLYSGNIVIHRDKAYEFDPRSLWTITIKKAIVKCLLIREIDRRPVSNLDWDEVKKRGDATDSDEILIKVVTKAIIEKQKKAVTKGAIIAVVVIIVAVIIFMLFFS